MQAELLGRTTSYNNMNILITGATGFIGRHLLKALIEKDHHCRCLVRKSSSVDELFDNPLIELFQGDVTKPETLKGVGKSVEVVYHLAAVGHVAAVCEDEESCKEYFKQNVEGTRSIVEACGRDSVKRFIHFSSTAAMGLIKRPVIDETVPCQPQTPYQKSKYESELAAFETGKKFGMEVIVLRPCMVYGPGGKGEFLKFCRLIKKGIFPRIGLGKNLTPIVHVSDVVQAAVNALDKGMAGEVYLIASETSPPLANIYGAITNALEVKRVYFYVPLSVAYVIAFILEIVASLSNKSPLVSRKNIMSTVTDRLFSISKAQHNLNYTPSSRIYAGISETVDWYRRVRII